jgi:hypothetical protein
MKNKTSAGLTVFIFLSPFECNGIGEWRMKHRARNGMEWNGMEWNGEWKGNGMKWKWKWKWIMDNG